MPAIIPSYVYSLFAALIVGTIVVFTCSVSTISIRNEADIQQLTNISQYIATQGLALVAQTNQNSTQFLELPSQIGNQRYWVRLTSGSSGAWVESGFGVIANQTQFRINMPAGVSASGVVISGSGRALMQCVVEEQVVTLKLSSE